MLSIESKYHISWGLHSCRIYATSLGNLFLMIEWFHLQGSKCLRRMYTMTLEYQTTMSSWNIRDHWPCDAKSHPRMEASTTRLQNLKLAYCSSYPTYKCLSLPDSDRLYVLMIYHVVVTNKKFFSHKCTLRKKTQHWNATGKQKKKLLCSEKIFTLSFYTIEEYLSLHHKILL